MKSDRPCLPFLLCVIVTFNVFIFIIILIILLFKLSPQFQCWSSFFKFVIIISIVVSTTISTTSPTPRPPATPSRQRARCPSGPQHRPKRRAGHAARERKRQTAGRLVTQLPRPVRRRLLARGNRHPHAACSTGGYRGKAGWDRVSAVDKV